jgi:hypothetical protein
MRSRVEFWCDCLAPSLDTPLRRLLSILPLQFLGRATSWIDRRRSLICQLSFMYIARLEVRRSELRRSRVEVCCDCLEPSLDTPLRRLILILPLQFLGHATPLIDCRRL